MAPWNQFFEKVGNGFVRSKTRHEFGLKEIKDVDFTMHTFWGSNVLGFDYWFGSAEGHNIEPFVFMENRHFVHSQDLESGKSLAER